MPDDFPDAELTEFMREARRVLIAPAGASVAWAEFAGASNLIGWRFRASYDAWMDLRASIGQFGDGADHEQLYRRERALFMLFSAGVSSVESAAYALAAAASHPKVLGLTFDDRQRRACSPKNLAAWLDGRPAALPLALPLAELLDAPEWALWVDLRNRMTHRSNLPRRLFVHAGSNPPPPAKPLNYAATSSSPEVDAGLADFDALQLWLARTVRSLLVGGTALLRGA